MSVILELPEELASRLRTLAAERGQELDRYALTALTELVNRADAGKAEGQRLLHGPGHRLDLEEVRRNAGLPPGRTPQEIEASYDEALAALTPEQRANAERLGLI